MSETLPPQERARILTGRLTNLWAGKGDHSPQERATALRDAEQSLAQAMSELPAAGRG